MSHSSHSSESSRTISQDVLAIHNAILGPKETPGVLRNIWDIISHTKNAALNIIGLPINLGMSIVKMPTGLAYTIADATQRACNTVLLGGKAGAKQRNGEKEHHHETHDGHHHAQAA